jgi:hypothetical protein
MDFLHLTLYKHIWGGVFISLLRFEMFINSSPKFLSMVKTMYVAHPVSGNLEGNKQSILGILHERHTSDVISLAPYLAALEYLDDNDPRQRALGIRANTEHFERGMFDEVGIFGERVSLGMFHEIELAQKMGIPINGYDERASVDLQYVLEGLAKGIQLPKQIKAERVGKDGNSVLYFIRPPTGETDLIIARCPIVLDPSSQRDVTRFVTYVDSYDEIYDGWRMFADIVEHTTEQERPSLIDTVYDSLAELYEKKVPLGKGERGEILFEHLAA